MSTRVFAHIDISHQSENCCSVTTEHSHNDCCKSHKKKDKKEKDCDDTCGNFSCHCPTTTSLPINFYITAEELNPIGFNTFKNLWNYAKQQPKPIYFQIWSPPQLS